MSESSFFQQIDKPSGSSYFRSQVLGSVTKRAIRRHERHLTRGIGSDGKQCVVTTARSMKYRNAVGHPRIYSGACLSFKDHDNGFGKPLDCRRGTNSPYKFPGCPWSIPPPAVRT